MREKLIVVLLLSGFLAVNAGSEPEMSDFGRYQVILQRRPFGAAPDNRIVSTPPVSPVVDPFKNYRLVAITRGDAGDVSVGIIDIEAKPVQSIFLSLGQSDQDLTLVDADYELEGAFVRKGRDEKWLYLGGSTLGGGVTSSGSASGGLNGASEDERGVPSYIERMRARRTSSKGGISTTTIEPSKLTGKELEAKLQAYNMDLIRQAAKGEASAPPLPIPLTPEQDKQLVDEGVLPAQ